MTPFLQRVFRIEPGEGRKVAQFAGLGLLLQAGLALGTAGADSLFLVNVGADKLPHIYLLTPLVMMIYIPAYSYLLARWGVNRVFDLTLGLLFAGGTGLWFAFQAAGGATPLVLCYVAKLYAAAVVTFQTLSTVALTFLGAAASATARATASVSGSDRLAFKLAAKKYAPASTTTT